MSSKQRDGTKERFWRDALERQAASGLSVRLFCRRERLAESNFYAWRQTLAKRDKESLGARRAEAGGCVPRRSLGHRNGAAKQPAFVPMVLTDEPKSSSAITIELRSGMRLRVPECTPAERLAELVDALERRGEQ